MDLLETAAVCALVLRISKKKIRRRYWVHPIYSCRLLKGKFYTPYENLREHLIKFFSYFRMNISTFDDQQLAYLGSDIILRPSLCLGVCAVIYFSRRRTVGTHNYQRLSAELGDTIVLPLTYLTVCTVPLTPQPLLLRQNCMRATSL